MVAVCAAQGFESLTFRHKETGVGYYTRFRVSFRSVGEPDPYLPFIQTDTAEAFVPTLNALLVDGVFQPDGWSCDTLKWYDWELDMMRASAQMPGVLMILTGSGEDDGDLWRAYFLDGRVQSVRSVVEFPPFDQDSLRDKPHMPRRELTSVWE